MSTYAKKVERTMKAIKMEKVDKIPFSYNGPAYVAKRAGLTMAEFVSDFDKATDASIKFCLEHPGVDSIHSPIFTTEALPMLWDAEVKVPGRDLPADELWQMHEYERMDMDDYEKIVKYGYEAWWDEFVKSLNVDWATMGRYQQAMPKTLQRMVSEAGVPVMNGAGTCGGPIEGFCGARTLMNFFMDIMEEPELVKAAMDKAFEVQFRNYLAMLDMVPQIPGVFNGAWVGGWRAAPNMLSHDAFMEFCWPYIEKYILATLERNITPVLHFDSNWLNEMETLKTLPEKSIILMLDGATPIRKAKEILGDHMCILGDVPSTITAYGTAEESYNYVSKLIDDIGPSTGLIISTGCDAPLNAKDENIDAIIQATLDYHVK